ncbi:MAG: response regulator [Pseudomonadales bacterium]|nr:response regulator [Pseudomonadales bacterium]
MTDIKKTILVVDDEADNIHLLSHILKVKYRVKAATSGAKALQIAEKQPMPAAILLDIMMPEMDGFEVCAQLKKHENMQNIPVLFVTGNNDAQERQRALAAGAVAYLSKPVNAAELQSILAQHIQA